MDPLIKLMLIWTRVHIGTGPLLMEILIDDCDRISISDDDLDVGAF